MEDESPLALAVSFQILPDNCPASAGELEPIESFLPEPLKELLVQADMEGEQTMVDGMLAGGRVVYKLQ